jgi:cell division protein FtsI/penicillin-binding protein 2
MDRRGKSAPQEPKRFGQSRRGSYSRYAILALFVVTAASQARLQIFERQSTIDAANKMHRYEFTEVQPAKRGDILARGGEPLAKDDTRSDLEIDFKRCPNTEPFWLDLSRASGLPATELSQFAEEAGQSQNPRWERDWPRAVNWSQANAVDEVVSKWRADGVGVTQASYRSYPLGDAASCLVGIIHRNLLPVTKGTPAYDRALAEHRLSGHGAADELTGLEESQDSILRGVDGKQQGVKDRNGNFLPMRVELQQPKKDGQDITLTIDQDLQTFASAQIAKAVKENQADSGSILIEDPATGDILAMANAPSFVPYNADGSYNPSSGKDQAFMDCLEPGSMFKILTLGKALDAGVVHMNDTFFCPGEKVVVPHSRPIKCDLEATGRAMGLLDPVHAIARSCNIWAATWAVHIGYQPFKDYLASLGLFEAPKIGVYGTRSAMVNWHDPARQLQLANLGFGQSINCTPLGLIGAFSALANDGSRVPPRLIMKIGGEEVAAARPTRVLSKESCENVKKGMVAVMEDPRGTGRSLRIPGYRIAGKTGTAQKVGNKKPGHVSNFVGFLPAENPRVVILVMIDHPKGAKYYGAAVAGPVFRSMAKEVIRKYKLVPTEPIVSRPLGKESPPADVNSDDEDDEASTPPPVTLHHKSKRKRIADDA